MSVSFNPRGAWTALVTPFGPNGRIDQEAFKRLTAFQVAQGIDGLVPAGTTGESPSLTWEEHIHVMQVAIEVAADKAGVLAGTGSNSTQEAISATKHAQEAGASAALLVDCYYNKPSSLELRTEYYQRVLDEVPDLPLVPYIIPGRSVTALSAADLAILHLQNPERILAVKQATGNLERMREDRRLAGDNIAIMSGDDDLTLTMMNDGEIKCSGVISVMTNLLPATIVKMVHAQLSGDTDTANAIRKNLAPIFKLVGCSVQATRTLPDGTQVSVEDKYSNPVPVKAMMNGLGMPAGACRPPVGKMEAAGVAVCRDAVKEVFAAAPEYFAPIAENFDVSIEARLNDDAVWASLARV